MNCAFIKPDGYSYCSWSQKHIENIPASESIAWNLYIEAQDKVDNKKENLLQFNLGNDDQIATLKEELKELERRLKRNGLTAIDKINLTDCQGNCTIELKGITDSCKKIEDSLKGLRIEVKAYKKTFEGEYNKRT